MLCVCMYVRFIFLLFIFFLFNFSTCFRIKFNNLDLEGLLLCVVWYYHWFFFSFSFSYGNLRYYVSKSNLVIIEFYVDKTLTSQLFYIEIFSCVYAHFWSKQIYVPKIACQSVFYIYVWNNSGSEQIYAEFGLNASSH